MFPANTSVLLIYPNPTLRQMNLFVEYKNYCIELDAIHDSEFENKVNQYKLINGV